MTSSATGNKLLRLLPEFLTRDIWRKCFALILAALCCWLIKRQVETDPSNQSIDTIDEVKLHITTDDFLYVRDEDRIHQVQIRIKKNYAQRNMNFTAKDFSFEVMLSSRNLGNTDRQFVRQISENSYEVTLPLTADDIRTKPGGVSILRLTPSEIKVQCERIIAATVPVSIQTTGILKEGLDWKPTPQTIKAIITGPASQVNTINELHTFPIPLNQLPEGKSELPLRLVDIPQAIRAEPDTNTLHVDVFNTQTTASYQFKDVPLLVLNRQNNSLILKSKLPETVSVILNGLKTSLDELEENPNQLMMCVDLSPYYAPGAHRAPVKALNLPAGITRVEWIDQTEIPVTLENSPEAYPAIYDPTPFLNGPTADERLDNLLDEKPKQDGDK